MAKKGEETTPLVSAVEAATQQRRQQQQPSGSAANSTGGNTKAKPIYTEAKARHLARVYTAILTVFFIQGWLTIMIIDPLKDDEKLMVRNTSRRQRNTHTHTQSLIVAICVDVFGHVCQDQRHNAYTIIVFFVLFIF